MEDNEEFFENKPATSDPKRKLFNNDNEEEEGDENEFENDNGGEEEEEDLMPSSSSYHHGSQSGKMSKLSIMSPIFKKEQKDKILNLKRNLNERSQNYIRNLQKEFEGDQPKRKRIGGKQQKSLMDDEDTFIPSPEGEIDEDEDGEEFYVKSGTGMASSTVDPKEEEDSEQDDPKGLEGAAFQSRLPFDRLSTVEARAFPDIAKALIHTQKLYLYLRNRILQIWVESPKKEVTLDIVWTVLDEPYNADKEIVSRVFEFLNRHGFINFGVFEKAIKDKAKSYNKRERETKKKIKVIVIGAGIAGLAAAQQLKRFGMEVVVLESRDRVGGRIATFRKNHFVADLGAMVVTGLGGNPINILSKQIEMKLTRIRQKCPLFESNGETVQKEKDEKIEKEFNRLLEATSYLSHHVDFNFVNDKPVSLGQALEWVIKLQEKHVKEKQLEYYNLVKDYLTKQTDCIGRIVIVKKQIEELHEKYKELKQINNKDIAQEFSYRTSVKELSDAIKEYEKLDAENKSLETNIANLEVNPPCEVYLNPRDRQILDWHFANLEFANAAPLSNLSLKHWDQDDDWEFTGNHHTLRNGYSCLPIALSKGLDIQFNTCVRRINTSLSNRVEITTTESEASDSPTIHQADVVLCTLPLGVLRHSLQFFGGQVIASNNINFRSTCLYNAVEFNPPLPNWKVESIMRLGYGNLNKVVLCFETIFWDTNTNLFGHVASTTSSRGELFLFWNLYQAPVLLALVAGDAAAVMEEVSDDVVVGRCIAVLRSIFGNSVPQPRDTIVTRWKNDPWTRGSYSFVAVGASGNDYDVLSTPVFPNSDKLPGEDELNSMNETETNPPRLFFAGEHTIRNYPATVHGAFLSGLREAGIVADIFLGKPYSIEAHEKIKTESEVD